MMKGKANDKDEEKFIETQKMSRSRERFWAAHIEGMQESNFHSQWKYSQKKTKKHRSDKARRNKRLQLLQSANISIVNSFFIANQLRSRQQ